MSSDDALSKYNIIHYVNECKYRMTTLIWSSLQIGITYEIEPWWSPLDEPIIKAYITPEIKGINNNNRAAFKILEIDTREPNVRFAPNSPFFTILKKRRYHQHSITFIKFIKWLQSVKQKIPSRSSLVETLFNKSLIYDDKFSKSQKERAQEILHDMDGLCHQIFNIQNKLNEQVKQIYIKSQYSKIYFDNNIKTKILMNHSLNKYFKNNITKHGIIFHMFHLTFFKELKWAFNIIQIDEFPNIMNSSQYIYYILQCLNQRFEGIGVISQMVMEYCELYFLLPLEKSAIFDRKHTSFSPMTGVFFHWIQSDGSSGKNALRIACSNNECVSCYFRKKNQFDQFPKNNGNNKENESLLQSFNDGIAYNIDDNRYYICV